jgi:hypothetical protein
MSTLSPVAAACDCHAKFLVPPRVDPSHTLSDRPVPRLDDVVPPAQLTFRRTVRDEASLLQTCWDRIAEQDPQALRMIDWLMREAPDKRPSALEVLHSTLVPDHLAETSVEHEVSRLSPCC